MDQEGLPDLNQPSTSGHSLSRSGGILSACHSIRRHISANQCQTTRPFPHDVADIHRPAFLESDNGGPYTNRVGPNLGQRSSNLYRLQDFGSQCGGSPASQSSPTMMSGSSASIRSEVRQLFQPYHNKRFEKKSRIVKEKGGKWYTRSLFLLKNYDGDLIPKRREKEVLIANGNLLHGVTFNTSWTESDVLLGIRGAFGHNIQIASKLELLVCTGSKLHPIFLAANQTNGIDGNILSQASNRKTVYIRPSLAEVQEFQDPLNIGNSSVLNEMNNYEAMRNNVINLDSMSDSDSSAPGPHLPMTNNEALHDNVINLDSMSDSDNSETGPHLPMTNNEAMRDTVINLDSMSDSDRNGNFQEPIQSTTNDENDEYRYLQYINMLTDEQLLDPFVDHTYSSLTMTNQTNLDATDHAKFRQETLKSLVAKISITAFTRINVTRSNVWDGFLVALQRANFNPNNQILVKFADGSGETEDGIDLGGPKRELLRLVLQDVIKSGIFYSAPTGRYLTLNKTCKDKKKYFYAGKMIAMVLIHGGPSPEILAPTMYDHLVGKTDLKAPLTDLEEGACISKEVNMFSKAKSIEELQHAANLSHYLYDSGYTMPIIILEQGQEIAQHLTNWFLFDKNDHCIQQFQNGLKTLGLFDAIMENPNAAKAWFVPANNPLTADQFSKLFKLQRSETGSNNWYSENQIVTYWEDFLLDCEEGQHCTLAAILIFATGLEKEPPLGFDPSPKLSFAKDGIYPIAKTCANTLILPPAKNREDFNQHMTFGILNTQGFTLA